jgi:hypothetical protein
LAKFSRVWNEVCVTVFFGRDAQGIAMEKKTFDILSKRLRQDRPVPGDALPSPIQAALLRLAAKELCEQLPKAHRASA